MKTPYLIQQARFQNISGKGIDQLLNFTYMGSAEFEHNAIPESLTRIRKQDNVLFHLSVGDKIVGIYCNVNDTEVIQKYIQGLSKDKYRLKTMSGFNYWVNNENMKWLTADFWWDIRNDFMFWKKDTMFESKFMMVI